MNLLFGARGFQEPYLFQRYLYKIQYNTYNQSHIQSFQINIIDMVFLLLEIEFFGVYDTSYLL